MSHSISERSVCHVVRRYGCVGGMESYVWHLSHAQLDLGYNVSVVFESLHGEVDPRISITRVAPARHNHRWRQMLAFRDAVHRYFSENRVPCHMIIHSHERCFDHHVTTFHGPPMVASWWQRRLSLRIRAWEHMERTEVDSDQRPLIVPVSNLLKVEILQKYPEVEVRLLDAAYPGITVAAEHARFQVEVEPRRLVFVGVDWKRKGLARALVLLNLLKKKHSNVSLDVIGAPEKVRDMTEKAGARWVGWQEAIDFHQYDLLVHPAKKEPFGMVIGEARATGCRVLCSDQCGAAELYQDDEGLIALPMAVSDSVWLENILELLARPRCPQSLSRPWSVVAIDYHQNVYDLLGGNK